MSLLQKILTTAVRFMPDRQPDPLLDQRRYVGQPLDRADGRAKVTGQARFTAEHDLERLAHASLVCSTIAKGFVTGVDASDAEKAPGFIGIITHENMPRLKRPSLMKMATMDKGFALSDLPILQDAGVHWDGQPVAVVVAETSDQAEHAAALVRVTYDTEPARVSFEAAMADAFVPPDVLEQPSEITLGGDAERHVSEAVYHVDHVYRTPPYNHNAIELQATVAAWSDDGMLTLFEATQGVVGHKESIAAVLDIDPEHVRVICPFVGGAFGGKAALSSNTALCAVAARMFDRPVRLVLSRAQVYRMIGGRAPTQQRVALGADAQGRLRALIHTGTSASTTHARFAENFSFPARHLYGAASIRIGQKVTNLDTVANSWMRAPGESVGSFALESAIDELAWTLNIDPIELRQINEPEKDPTHGTPFSSRHLVEAMQRGAEAFGWNRPRVTPRTQTDGTWLIGQGVATSYYPYYRFPGVVRLRLSADGTVLVRAAANEMGMGVATVQLQHAADRLGVSIEQVSFEYGDSNLPNVALAGGSSQTATITDAVRRAAEQLHRELLKLAHKSDDSPLAKADLDEVEARNGGLFLREHPDRGETYTAILERAGLPFIEIDGESSTPLELLKYSMGSYGAHFCEVRVHSETGEVRLSRWLAAYDCGRILNPKTAASQLRGGIIMGIGMALTEETQFDPRRGRIMNPSLSEYHVPVHLDVPPIEIIFTDTPDEHAPLGARGVGEIGITGAAAAVANAIYHATGRRVRDLPITLDKLI